MTKNNAFEKLITTAKVLRQHVEADLRDASGLAYTEPRWLSDAMEHIQAAEAALKNPSDAGGEYMCENCVTPWKCNGPHLLPPQADTPIKGAGEEVMRREIIDEINTDAGNSFWDSVNGPKPKREDVSGEEMKFNHDASWPFPKTPAPIDADVREAFKRVKVFCDESTKQIAPFMVDLKKKLDADLETIRAALKKGVTKDA